MRLLWCLFGERRVGFNSLGRRIMALTVTRVMQFKHLLQTEWAHLRDEIQLELMRVGGEPYADIAGQLAAAVDASVGDLLVNVSLPSIRRQVDELQAVEAALKRISRGRFGICEICGDEIAPERLEKKLSVGHCLICQGALENSASQGFDFPRL
jgi:DnaK suppressor protein